MSKVDFSGRVAIVTGSGGGLGRTYALELAARGAAVVINDLGGSFDGKGGSHRMADEVVNEIRAAGGKAVANYDSVGSRAGGEAIVQAALDAFGRVDIVINNAGHLRTALFEDLDDETLDSLLNVHLKGAIYVTQPAYKLMKQQGYGRIVFTSSGASIFGSPQQTAYAAAKAGLIGVMNVISLEGQEHGVFCNALLPTAHSRMADAIDPKQREAYGKTFTSLAEVAGQTHEPTFVTPLVVYLASEACQSTHSLYSASVGRYARAFVGLADGWNGPRQEPASVEEVAANFDQICDTRQYNIPGSLIEEFEIINRNLRK